MIWNHIGCYLPVAPDCTLCIHLIKNMTTWIDHWAWLISLNLTGSYAVAIRRLYISSQFNWSFPKFWFLNPACSHWPRVIPGSFPLLSSYVLNIDQQLIEINGDSQIKWVVSSISFVDIAPQFLIFLRVCHFFESWRNTFVFTSTALFDVQ